MRAHAAALALTTFVVATIACVPSTEQEEPAVEEVTSTETDIEAINDVRERWITAVNAADVDEFLTLVTADVEWMPPDEEVVGGERAGSSHYQRLRRNVRRGFRKWRLGLHSRQRELGCDSYRWR